MARLTRLSFAGVAHLVVLTSAEGRSAFEDDDDRRRFMLLALECSRACDLAIHAYCLLDDRVLLLVTPAQADGLSRFMQRLGRKYVGAFNLRHGRHGALWARRYGAAAIDPATRGWASIRLIEQAPVRAGKAPRAQDWPWSSAPHHVGLLRNPVVREHELHWRLGNTPFEREARHAQMLADPLPSGEADALVAAANRGWPIGPTAFVEALSDAAEGAARPLQPRPRGRPKAVRPSPNQGKTSNQ